MQVDFTLHCPFSITLAGPTCSGKTFFTFNFIERRHEITSERLEKVIYVYGEYQEKFKEFGERNPDVIFTDNLENLPSITEKNCLIILDDMMLNFENSKNGMITELFIRGAHHRKQSVILILQVNRLYCKFYE